MIPRKANRIAKKWPKRYYNDLKTRLRKAKRRKERIPPLAKTRGDRTGGGSPGVAGALWQLSGKPGGQTPREPETSFLVPVPVRPWELAGARTEMAVGRPWWHCGCSHVDR